MSEQKSRTLPREITVNFPFNPIASVVFYPLTLNNLNHGIIIVTTEVKVQYTCHQYTCMGGIQGYGKKSYCVG